MRVTERTLVSILLFLSSTILSRASKEENGGASKHEQKQQKRLRFREPPMERSQSFWPSSSSSTLLTEPATAHTEQTSRHRRSQQRKRRHNPSHQREHHQTPVLSESRIIGGHQASIGDYPYFVSWDGCGGSLIHADIVLTAAHCNTQSTRQLWVGAYRRGSPQGHAQPRTLVRRIPHPAFHPDTLAHDFLLLQLNEPVPGTPTVFLNGNAAAPFPEQTLTAMGLGSTRENSGEHVQVLRGVDVTAVSNKQCSRMYGGRIDENTMLCAGSPGGRRDTCQGDSGGPLIIQHDHDTHIQVGVTSWGYGCGREDFPGVYSRVSEAVGWIQQQICLLSSMPPPDCPTNPSLSRPLPPPGQRRPSPSPPTLWARVVIRTDAYPEDVGWTIRQRPSGKLVHKQEYGSLRQGTNVREVRLNAGQSYTFAIADSWGDGICCRYGNGRFDIYAIQGNELTPLAAGQGSYGGGTSRRLTVPSSFKNSDHLASSSSSLPSAVLSQPTQAPSEGTPCINSGRPIYVNEDREIRSCAWLKANKQRYEYLCQFTDVAATCPAVCNSACS